MARWDLVQGRPRRAGTVRCSRPRAAPPRRDRPSSGCGGRSRTMSSATLRPASISPIRLRSSVELWMAAAVDGDDDVALAQAGAVGRRSTLDLGDHRAALRASPRLRPASRSDPGSPRRSGRAGPRRSAAAGPSRLRAMLAGTAKPIPTLPPPGARIAVLMPISSPLELISAPPELPGLIDGVGLDEILVVAAGDARCGRAR